MIGSLGLGLFSLGLFGLFLWLFISKVIGSMNMDSKQIEFWSSNKVIINKYRKTWVRTTYQMLCLVLASKLLIIRLMLKSQIWHK